VSNLPGSQRQRPIETVDQIKALLPELQASLPNDVDVQTVADRTTTSRRLAPGGRARADGHIILVRSGPLRLPALGAWPASSPRRGAGFADRTFRGMYLLGFSINNLSRMAM